MQIVTAEKTQFEAVLRFYYSLIDGMRDSPCSIGWKKGIYPAPEFLKTSIANRELYIGLEDNCIAAAMVLNHRSNDGYRGISWPLQAAEDEVTLIHALGVHPFFGGRGFAKALVAEAISVARANRQKTIRLDVLRGNTPAEKLYAGMGFRYVDTLKMYYEDTGWTDYELYEYVL